MVTCFSLKRSWTSKKVCWRCHVDQNSRSDVRLQPDWLPSSDLPDDLPWLLTAPPLLTFPGLSPRLIAVDLLHALYLGQGRSFCASIIIDLEAQAHWPGNNKDARLNAAFADFMHYAQSNHKSVDIGSFSSAKTDSSEKHFPDLSCKGADTAVLLQWLAAKFSAELQNASRRHTVIATATFSLNCFCRLIMQGDVFLRPNESETAGSLLSTFCDALGWLHADSISNGKLLFNIQPKGHLLCHIFWIF